MKKTTTAEKQTSPEMPKKEYANNLAGFFSQKKDEAMQRLDERLHDKTVADKYIIPNA